MSMIAEFRFGEARNEDPGQATVEALTRRLCDAVLATTLETNFGIPHQKSRFGMDTDHTVDECPHGRIDAPLVAPPRDGVTALINLAMNPIPSPDDESGATGLMNCVGVVVDRISHLGGEREGHEGNPVVGEKPFGRMTELPKM
jgi:hypothetical protein